MNGDEVIELKLSDAYMQSSGLTEAISIFSEQLAILLNDIVEPTLKNLAQSIRNIIEIFNEYTKEKVNSYNITELHIPKTNHFINESSNLSQAPPREEKIIFINGNQYNYCDVNTNQTDSTKKCFDWKYWLALSIPTIIGIIDLLITLGVI